MKDEIITKPCVGCGFCCKKAPCSLAVRVFNATDSCPMLVWDEEQHRYFCDACRKPGEIGARYREELYIGEGCCCGLNSDRQNIQPPITSHKVANPMSHDAQVLLAAVAKQWISSDVFYFILRYCQDKLGTDWANAAANLVDEQRSSQTKNFMG